MRNDRKSEIPRRDTRWEGKERPLVAPPVVALRRPTGGRAGFAVGREGREDGARAVLLSPAPGEPPLHPGSARASVLEFPAVLGRTRTPQPLCEEVEIACRARPFGHGETALVTRPHVSKAGLGGEEPSGGVVVSGGLRRPKTE